jgi:hypothetical protein
MFRIAFWPGWLAAAAVILGTSAASAQTIPRQVPSFPTPATTGSGMSQVQGFPTPATNFPGSTTPSSLPGLGAILASLLTPDQQVAVLFDSIATADALIDQLGLQFDNPVELLVFVMMIHEQKLAAAIQAMLSDSGIFPTLPMP